MQTMWEGLTALGRCRHRVANTWGPGGLKMEHMLSSLPVIKFHFYDIVLTRALMYPAESRLSSLGQSLGQRLISLCSHPTKW